MSSKPPRPPARSRVAARRSRSATGPDSASRSRKPTKAIARVLAGKEHYDTLAEFDQAAVRAAWDEGIEGVIGSLDYEEQFRAAGESWAEADDQGNLVIRDVSGTE